LLIKLKWTLLLHLVGITRRAKAVIQFAGNSLAAGVCRVMNSAQ